MDSVWGTCAVLLTLVTGLAGEAAAGDVTDSILSRVTVRDTATGAILKVKPRPDSPADGDLDCRILSLDPNDAIRVWVEDPPEARNEAVGWGREPRLHEHYWLRPNAALLAEGEKWKKYRQAQMRREFEQLDGEWIQSDEGRVVVIRFDPGLHQVTISIDDPALPMGKLVGHYEPYLEPAARQIELTHGDRGFRLDYRREGDIFRLRGEIGMVYRGGGKLRYQKGIALRGDWRRKSPPMPK